MNYLCAFIVGSASKDNAVRGLTNYAIQSIQLQFVKKSYHLKGKPGALCSGVH